MSIFDGLIPLKEEDRIKTKEQSYDLIMSYVKEYENVIDFKNHRISKLRGESKAALYRFTIRLLSLDFLKKMQKDKRVKNVFFALSAAPPGGAIDGISLRYKVYIEYH